VTDRTSSSAVCLSSSPFFFSCGISDYRCSYRRAGRMYITPNYVCFWGLGGLVVRYLLLFSLIPSRRDLNSHLFFFLFCFVDVLVLVVGRDSVPFNHRHWEILWNHLQHWNHHYHRRRPNSSFLSYFYFLSFCTLCSYEPNWFFILRFVSSCIVAFVCLLFSHSFWFQHSITALMHRDETFHILTHLWKHPLSYVHLDQKGAIVDKKWVLTLKYLVFLHC